MFLNIGFTDEWWYKKHGIRFDRAAFMDPLLKAAQQDKMNGVMRGLFDKWRFLTFPAASVEPFGHRYTPAMFGAPIRYQIDQPPWAQTIKLEKDVIMSMEPVTEAELSEHPCVKEIIRQCEVMKKAGRPASAQQNFGGVMNTAIYLRGDSLFYDFYDEPEMIRKLFGLIVDMILTSHEYFCKIDGHLSPIGIGNCSVAMLSPEIYTEFVRPFDMRIMEYARERGISFGIHQDSFLDPFIEAYRAFDYAAAFDIGADTDVARFRRAFPEQTVNVCFYASTLSGHSAEGLYDFMAETAQKGGPLDRIGFTVTDIDIDVPMEKIIGVCDAYAYLKDKEEREAV
ncbi:MAG: hypothetical protein FWC55_04390 [Firmicutes bacterium]|nr:hypothetical protein [Bacillota bacterium]